MYEVITDEGKGSRNNGSGVTEAPLSWPRRLRTAAVMESTIAEQLFLHPSETVFPPSCIIVSPSVPKSFVMRSDVRSKTHPGDDLYF